MLDLVDFVSGWRLSCTHTHTHAHTHTHSRIGINLSSSQQHLNVSQTSATRSATFSSSLDPLATTTTTSLSSSLGVDENDRWFGRFVAFGKEGKPKRKAKPSRKPLSPRVPNTRRFALIVCNSRYDSGLLPGLATDTALLAASLRTSFSLPLYLSLPLVHHIT